jgi:hypothetical protein
VAALLNTGITTLTVGAGAGANPIAGAVPGNTAVATMPGVFGESGTILSCIRMLSKSHRLEIGAPGLDERITQSQRNNSYIVLHDTNAFDKYYNDILLLYSVQFNVIATAVHVIDI